MEVKRQKDIFGLPKLLKGDRDSECSAVSQAGEELAGGGFVSIQDLSLYLAIKPSTIYAMVEERTISHFRIGKLIRFKRSEIDLWMEGNRQECVGPEKVARKVLSPIQKHRTDIYIHGKNTNLVIRKMDDEAISSRSIFDIIGKVILINEFIFHIPPPFKLYLRYFSF